MPPENFGLPSDFSYDVVVGLGYSDVEPEKDADGLPVYLQLPDCDVMQLDVQDSTGNVERWLISLSGGPGGANWLPTFAGAAVETRTTADIAPRVGGAEDSDCDVVSGVPLAESEPRPEPIEALVSFIDSDEGRHFGMPATRWDEIDDSSTDRFWYVQHVSDDRSLAPAAVVAVERNDDGWALTGYEVTCG